MPRKSNKRGQNEGSIRKIEKKRKDGSKYTIYEARYSIGFNADGKQIQKSIYDKDRGELSKKLTAILNQLNTGTYTEPSKLTVGEWLDIWLETYKKDKVKDSSYCGYESNIRLNIKPVIGHIPLQALRAEHIQLLYDGVAKRLSGRMAQLVHVTLHGALKQALKTDKIMKNYSECVEIPKHTKKQSRVLTTEEQQAFTQAIKGVRYETAFLLDMFTGLRRGELLGLSWDNINFKDGTITVTHSLGRFKNYDSNIKSKTILERRTPKTPKSNRVIPLIDEMIAVLKAHKAKQAQERLLAGTAWQDNNMIFCNEIGGYVDPTTLKEYFYKAIERAGIPKANIHALRHSFATRCLENGVELKVTSEMLGHSTLALTGDLYSHVLLDKKREGMDKLKAVFQATAN